MTIAAGFVCSDGLIFASDTLYSSHTQNYGPKFWIIERGGTVVVFGGAGEVVGLTRAKDEINATLDPAMDRHQVVRCVESALLYVIQQQPQEEICVLVGIRIAGCNWLYENQAGALSVLNGNSQCVGSGFPLGLYFCDVLFKSNMPMKWAKVVAAHLIRTVKTHNPVYCGGDTNIVELPASGTARFITDRAEIGGYESHLQKVDDALRVVLPDGRANDDTIALRVETIAEAIKKASRSFVMQTEPGHYEVTSGSTSVFSTTELPRPRISYRPKDE